jgi:DNA adenine methylase
VGGDAAQARAARDGGALVTTAAAGGAAQIAPVLKYPGSKWRMASWIAAHLPAHTTYVEPYFGSGAVFFRKPPSRVETINDIDGRVVNLFRVIRDHTEALCDLTSLTPWARDEYEASYAVAADPVEDARRFLVRCWQAHGSRLGCRSGWRVDNRAGGDVLVAARWQRLPARIRVSAVRLRDAQIENRPALEVIENHRLPSALLYCDPPYLPEVRNGRMYECEMTRAEHRALLEALDRHPGPALVSGYASGLYDTALRHWRCVSRTAGIEGGQSRTERLWINPVACGRLGQLALPGWSGAVAGG